MKISVTGVITDRLQERYLPARLLIEDGLNKYFLDRNYGGNINTFIISIIATGSDAQNERFAESHNKSGRYVHPVTKEKVVYISAPVVFDESDICGLSLLEFSCVLMDGVCDGVDIKSLKYPKAFNADGFVKDFKSYMGAIKQANLQLHGQS